MNAVMDKLPALVAEELKAANTIHNSFHNQHEGYAVLLEEVEETRNELFEVQFNLQKLWGCVKCDCIRDGIDYAHQVEKYAIRLAAEAIQVAAMARKFRAVKTEGDDAK